MEIHLASALNISLMTIASTPIPGYGTKNRRGLYIFNFDRENLGINGLEAGFSAREYGGVRSEAIRATFKPPHNPGELEYKFHSSLSRETLFSADDRSGNGEISETGKSKHFFTGTYWRFQAKGKLSNKLEHLERAALA